MPWEFQAKQAARQLQLRAIGGATEKKAHHIASSGTGTESSMLVPTAIWIQPLRDYNYWLTLLVIPGQRIMQSQPLYTLGLGQNFSVYHLLKMIILLISISLFSPAFQNKTEQCTSHPLTLNNNETATSGVNQSEIQSCALSIYLWHHSPFWHWHEFLSAMPLGIKQGAVTCYSLFFT